MAKTKGPEKHSNGRPVRMSPYQVSIPAILRNAAVKKARANGTNVSLFVRMAIEQFVNDPIEESMDRLRVHKERYEQKQRTGK
jgi:hypothetical protein